jgi:hypothetical protein
VGDARLVVCSQRRTRSGRADRADDGDDFRLDQAIGRGRATFWAAEVVFPNPLDLVTLDGYAIAGGLGRIGDRNAEALRVARKRT